LRRFDDAVESSETLLKLAPQRAEFRYQLGVMLYLAGRGPEAKARLQKAAQDEPFYTLMLQVVHADLDGDRSGSLAAAVRLRRSDPGNDLLIQVEQRARQRASAS
jgi:lipoprotein NlpI